MMYTLAQIFSQTFCIGVVSNNGWFCFAPAEPCAMWRLSRQKAGNCKSWSAKLAMHCRSAPTVLSPKRRAQRHTNTNCFRCRPLANLLRRKISQNSQVPPYGISLLSDVNLFYVLWFELFDAVFEFSRDVYKYLSKTADNIGMCFGLNCNFSIHCGNAK